MRTKVTLLLLVLVAGLSAFAYFFVFRDPRGPGAGDSASVLGAQAVDLDYLRIELRDPASRVVLEKKNTGWELTEPVNWRANFFAVNQLLTQLRYLKRESSFALSSIEANNKSLADFGLQPAEGVLTYGRGSMRRTLRVGEKTDVGRGVYILPEGSDRVIVVDQALRDTLRQELGALRDDKVFTLKPFEVRGWSVVLAASGNLRLRLVRRGDDWRFEYPGAARADREAVEALLTQVLGLTVAQFPAGQLDPNLLGLANPPFIVTVESSGQRESLLLGRPVEGAGPDVYYAKLDENDTIFTVRAPFLPRLQTAQVALRERRLVEFNPAHVQSIRLQPAGQPEIMLQKNENARWQVLARDALPMPGDKARVDTLLAEIANLRAVPDGGFVSDAPQAVDLEGYGLSGAAWTITLTESAPENQTRSHTIELGNLRSDGSHTMYARVREEGYVYLVDRALADTLRAEPYEYRDRQLRTLPEGARITSLKITRQANDEVVFSAALNGAENWDQALAAEPEARRQAALTLIEQVRNLRAESIVQPQFTYYVPDTPERRAWTWLLEAEITLESGAANQAVAPFRLFLDAHRAGADLRVGYSDQNLVFTARPAFVDAFAALVQPRPDPGPPPPPETRGPPAETTPPVESAPAESTAPPETPAATPPAATPANEPTPLP